MHKLFIKSAKDRIPVEIIYQSKDGKFTKRIIIIKKISSEHIFAYCLTKKQYRTFLIKQILAIQPYKKRQLPPA